MTKGWQQSRCKEQSFGIGIYFKTHGTCRDWKSMVFQTRLSKTIPDEDFNLCKKSEAKLLPNWKSKNTGRIPTLCFVQIGSTPLVPLWLVFPSSPRGLYLSPRKPPSVFSNLYGRQNPKLLLHVGFGKDRARQTPIWQDAFKAWTCSCIQGFILLFDLFDDAFELIFAFFPNCLVDPLRHWTLIASWWWLCA